MKKISKGLKLAYRRIVNSIAFLPALIAVAFLLLSLAAVTFDFSEQGKALKSQLHWLRLRDASTARSICTVITGGVISLTVFSFSMVMILLNQAASQMTNRVLGRLIGNRFQQTVLGCYIGTIVYGLFLLSTIRDIDSGIYIPAVSTYLLIGWTIVDIFLFIYFLHYITNSVRYETIINGIRSATMQKMKKHAQKNPTVDGITKDDGNENYILRNDKEGFYLGFDKQVLIDICCKKNIKAELLNAEGTYLLQGSPLLSVRSVNPLENSTKEALAVAIYISAEREELAGYYYGFQQLREIAVKALSPGINDPETAVMAIHALCSLLSFRLLHEPCHFITDDNDQCRIIVKNYTIDEMVERYFFPVWDYGKNDRVIRYEMLNVLPQLLQVKQNNCLYHLLRQVNKANTWLVIR